MKKNLKEMKQEGKTEEQNKVNFLKKLIERAKKKRIILIVLFSDGGKERLKITQKGIFEYDEFKCAWDKIINFSDGSVKILANRAGSVSSILEWILEKGVQIKVM